MVSAKQLGFYLVPSFPFYALAFASLIRPVSDQFMSWLSGSVVRTRILGFVSFGFLLVTVLLCVSAVGKPGRDREKISDIHKIGKVVPEYTVISTGDKICQDWGLLAYLMRYHKISIDCGTNHDFYLVAKGAPVMDHYVKVESGCVLYQLYKTGTDR